MAVLLTRENQDNRPNPSNLPQVTVRNLPVSTPERFQAGIVTGRTSNVYSCDNPGREVFWKSNYERYNLNGWKAIKFPILCCFCRRQSQLSDGGFHGPLGQKYQEVGDVELDDKTLILQGLGQVCCCITITHVLYISSLDAYTTIRTDYQKSEGKQ